MECSANDLLGFQISLLFGKDAAAVFLHIKSFFPCLGLPLLKVGAEVPIQELDAESACCVLSNLVHDLMTLIGTDEQRGSKSVIAILGSKAGGFPQTHLIALCAATVYVCGYLPNKGPKGIIVFLNQLQADLLRIVPETVPSRAIFRKRMNVGVIPEAFGVEALSAQRFDTHKAAWGTTDMEQEFHFDTSKHIVHHSGTDEKRENSTVFLPDGGKIGVFLYFLLICAIMETIHFVGCRGGGVCFCNQEGFHYGAGSCPI